MADGELRVDHTTEEAAAKPAPGQVIAPGNSAAPAEKSAPAAAAPQSKPAAAAKQPEPSPPSPEPPASAKPSAPEPPEPPEKPSAPVSASQQPADAAPAGADEADEANEVSWTASEFIAHEKSAGWYLLVALAGVVIAGIVFFITRDYISTVVVLVGTFALAMLGAKKPQQLQYRLSDNGLTIGQKHYAFHAFKSFAVVPEGAFSSIVFMPLKRFAPLTTIYYPPEEERQITDLLAQHLPVETHKLDAVDHLMQRIRF